MKRRRALWSIPWGKKIFATAEGKTPSTEVAEAIARLKALRRTTGKAPLAEILASRHKGHKY
jgi:hypothetical protein